MEEAISELRKRASVPQQNNWLRQIIGSFKDDPVFDKILTYGKAIRAGDESLLILEDK